MKIEMGESLVYSYLRQVKNCVITQTNWKNSGNWQYLPSAWDTARQLYDKIMADNEFSGIFPSPFDQTIKQAEIDAVGINDDTVFAVDIAYHEGGLSYGSKEDTKQRVVKKLLRTMLAFNLYFPEHKHIIMFCSPKVHNATENLVIDMFKTITGKYADEKTEFVYISNADFFREIIQPTLARVSDESDSAELFVRAVRMINLFDNSSGGSTVSGANGESPKPVKLNKADAAQIVGKECGINFRNKNIKFANFCTAEPVWWFDISNGLFSDELHLIMNDQHNSVLYYFRIPAGTIQSPPETFYQWGENKKNTSLIKVNVNTDFTDKSNGFSFKRFLEKRISY